MADDKVFRVTKTKHKNGNPIFTLKAVPRPKGVPPNVMFMGSAEVQRELTEAGDKAKAVKTMAAALDKGISKG